MSKHVDADALALAKTLYLKYTPINSIVDNSKIVRSTLMYHIPRWREERELMKSEIMDALSDSKKELMSSIAKNGLEVLAKSMQELAVTGRALSPKEMLGIANIVDSLDRITKLDNGQATDIIAEVRPASAIEIRKLLSRDPFLELEDAEIIEEIPVKVIGIDSDRSSNSGDVAEDVGDTPQISNE